MFVRIRKQLPLRIAEWMCALAMIGIGLYLVIWPSAFSRLGLSGFAVLAPVGVWVAASLCLGALRIGALVLNGHWPSVSAPLRCLGAICGVGLFSSIAAGYSLATSEFGPPMAIVLALVFVAGDLFSSARSAGDSFHAIRSGLKWTGLSH